jgi:hypothetical protein
MKLSDIRWIANEPSIITLVSGDTLLIYREKWIPNTEPPYVTNMFVFEYQYEHGDEKFLFSHVGHASAAMELEDLQQDFDRMLDTAAEYPIGHQFRFDPCA